MNEEKLLQDIKADPQRFAEIYEAFYADIFGYVLRRTANYDVAKDIAAETFLKAYQSVGSFRWRSISILHWLYRIASNETHKYFRRRSYRPSSLQRIREEYGVDVTDYSTAETERIRFEEELQQRKEFLRLHQFIRTLDIKYQEVIALRYFEHRTIEEIAAILGKKSGTVKSLLSRGVDKLRTAFEGRTDE